MNETTIENLKVIALSLNIQRIYNAWGFDFIVNPMLRGIDMAVKDGNKIFIRPDFDFPDELHYVDITEHSIDEINTKLHTDLINVPLNFFTNTYFACES